MGQYGVRLLGRGELAGAVRMVREISGAALSMSEIRERIERGEIVVEWDDENRDLLAALREQLDSITRDVSSLAATGYEIGRAYRPSASDPWKDVESFEQVMESRLGIEADRDLDDWPSWMTPRPDFTFAALQSEATRAAREVWTFLRATHPQEHVYAFGFYPAEDDLALQNACSTEEGILDIASRSQWLGGTLEDRLIAMRWADADWPYSCNILAPFGPVNAMLGQVRVATRAYLAEVSGDEAEWRRRQRRDVRNLMRAMRHLYLAALADVDQQGVFGDDREQIVLGIFGPAVEAIEPSIERLNPEHVLARWRRETAAASQVYAQISAGRAP